MHQTDKRTGDGTADPVDYTLTATYQGLPLLRRLPIPAFLKTLTRREQTALIALGFLYLSSWALSFAGVFDAVPFIDIPYHFFGGFFVGLLLIDVFRKALVAERILWHDVAVIVGAALMVGFFWELYELLLTRWIGDFFAARGITCCIGDAFDTLKDLLMDSLGAFTVFFLVRWRNRTSPMFH
ncbi:MAG: hypothetical protein Q8Q39_00045 [bacterium]|nr:hypothetical protein [bacterium]